MNTDSIIGCVLLVVALGVLCALVAWSRRTIETIHRKNVRSVRDIMQELKNGR